MKYLICIICLSILCALTAQDSWAQDPSRPQLDGLTQAGKLFTVKLTPKDRIVRIDLVGTPAAKLDLKNKQIEVYLIEGKSSRQIKVSRAQDGSFLSEPLTKQQNLELEVKAIHKTDSETFRFRLP